jgi:hypothetical protein
LEDPDIPVKKLAKLARIDTLADLSAEPVQKALARLSSPPERRALLHRPSGVRGYWCCETGRLASDPVAALRKPVADGKVFHPARRLHRRSCRT